MQFFTDTYNQVLGYFPDFLHPFISIGLAIFLIYSIFQVLRKDFIWLIALVLLLPASVPILQEVWEVLLAVIKYLLGKG
ncbi:hypothetical protein IPM19_01915 [bacterium]|nr:MAG: hypothetical protein IPM19_01915 [bacterium]